MIFYPLFSKWFGIYYANFNSGFNRKLAKDDWLSREYKGLSYWRVTSIWRWDQWVLYKYNTFGQILAINCQNQSFKYKKWM